jgi:hypothetical protein
LLLASKKKVITTRFIYDCLEEGRILKPAVKSNHVISFKGESTPTKGDCHMISADYYYFLSIFFICFTKDESICFFVDAFRE